MRTFILFWNPETSSFKLDDFQKQILLISTNKPKWSVWDYEEACSGDRFFMVRCGEGNTGICMSGYFASDPCKGEGESGDGREVYKVKLEADTAIHPDYRPILTTEELTKAIPDFDWTGGHSGILLDDSHAIELEMLWRKFLTENKEIFRQRAAYNVVDRSEIPSIKDRVQEVYIDLTKEAKVEGNIFLLGIHAKGDTIESVKRQIIEEIYQRTGKKPRIRIEFRQLFNDDPALFRKTVEYITKNKKRNTCIEWHHGGVEKNTVSWLSELGATTKSMKEYKFPEKIIKAVEVLRKRPKESYLQYVERVANNPIARVVLARRVNDALEIKSLEKIDENELKRINDDLAALHLLDPINKYRYLYGW